MQREVNNDGTPGIHSGGARAANQPLLRMRSGLAICCSISGLVGVDANGKLVGEGDAARQTRQIFETMRRVLEQAVKQSSATC